MSKQTWRGGLWECVAGSNLLMNVFSMQLLYVLSVTKIPFEIFSLQNGIRRSLRIPTMTGVSGKRASLGTKSVKVSPEKSGSSGSLILTLPKLTSTSPAKGGEQFRNGFSRRHSRFLIDFYFHPWTQIYHSVRYLIFFIAEFLLTVPLLIDWLMNDWLMIDWSIGDVLVIFLIY